MWVSATILVNSFEISRNPTGKSCEIPQGESVSSWMCSVLPSSLHSHSYLPPHVQSGGTHSYQVSLSVLTLPVFFLDLMTLKDIVNSSALLARLVMVLNQTLHAASTNNIQESHIKANYSMCLKHAYCKPQVSQQSAFFNYCTYCNFSYSTGVLITFPA